MKVPYEVDIDGRRHAIVIDADGPPDRSRLRIERDGRSETIDITPTDLGWSIRFEDGRVLDAAVTPWLGGGWLVQLPHVTIAAAIDGRRARGPIGEGGQAHGEQRITAPMPGRVVRVLVKAGDAVTARQGLVVVEAMKMENEVVSPKAGRVKQVAVVDGQSIESGRLLAVVE
jgi:biotin carboxyl carrier protein